MRSCHQGWDIEDESTAEECSTCVHGDLFSFSARQHAEDVGVPVDNHIHSFRLLSELQIEGRRRNVQQAKERSTCRRCGQTGLWAGDDKCPTRKGGSKGKAKAVPMARRAHVPRTSDVQKYPGTADDQRECLQYLFNPRRSAWPMLDQAWLESLSFQTRAHHENNVVAAPGTSWTPRIARARTMVSHNLSISLRLLTMVKTMMKGIHTTSKTVHFDFIEEAESEDDHTAMTAGKHVNDELSDSAVHDMGLSDSDLSADFGEGVPSSCVCASNDSAFQFGHKIPSTHETESTILHMGNQAKITQQVPQGVLRLGARRR